MDNDLRLKLMTGVDIPIPELQITIHPPSVKEIAYMGEQDFFMAIQYLCVDKESLIQDKTLLETLSNFQVLMKVLEQSKDKQHKKNAIRNLLLLLFPSYSATMLPNSIILTAKDMPPVTIDDNTFPTIQDYIKVVLCVNSIFQGSNIVYNPGNEAARKIMNKIMEGRKKVAQLKGGNKESVLTRYLSILTIGSSTITLKDAIDLTVFQVFDLIDRYNAFVEWDTDLRVRLAGGKPEKTVESWMRDLHPTL